MPASTLVLLPGLDGTGELFGPLLALARSRFELRPLRYDHEPDQSYARLAESVLPALPTQGSYALVAESFAGPLALRLAALRPPGLDAVVLVNSFVRSPLSLTQRLLAPRSARLLALAPEPALRRFLLGDDAPRELVAVLSRALASVPLSVLRARLSTLASCDETESYLRCMAPMFLLHSTDDRVLSASARSLLEYLRPGLVVESIAAPHLLLQRAPEAALAALERLLLDEKRQA